MIQRRANGAGDDGPRRSGAPLLPDVRAKMEQSFGADFSAVRIHQHRRAKAPSALAYPNGADIHTTPDQYGPHHQQGQELLGHELAHVVQPSQGKVGATTQADAMEARAARGEQIGEAVGPAQHDLDDRNDPRAQLRKQWVKLRTLERRTWFFQVVNESRDMIFHRQVSGRTLDESHTLLADKARPKKGTPSQYEAGLTSPEAPSLQHIHPELSLSWKLQTGDVKIGESARLVAKVIYPSMSVYEKTHEAVGAALAQEGLAEGFTYHERTKLEPDPAALRAGFQVKVDAYLERVLREELDDALKAFDGKLDYGFLPSFVS